LTETEIAALVLNHIWKFLHQQKRLELVPWNKDVLDLAKEESRQETLDLVIEEIKRKSFELKDSA
jgi:hypothetical protein